MNAALEKLAHEHAQNVVMHNDAFEMNKFRFDDPIAAWPKWAQSNYEYAKAGFLRFAQDIEKMATDSDEAAARIEKLDPIFMVEGRHAGRVMLVIDFRGDDYAAIKVAQNRILKVLANG